jgi:hypothetical protein
LNHSLRNEVFAVRGEPDHIRNDNGAEFANKAVKRWLAISGVKTLFMAPGSAFDKYDENLSAFNDISPDKLVLAALGPTAAALAYDLCNRGCQAIDIGHLDLEYEWFLRRDAAGTPLEFKYVDGSSEGRKIR